MIVTQLTITKTAGSWIDWTTAVVVAEWRQAGSDLLFDLAVGNQLTVTADAITLSPKATPIEASTVKSSSEAQYATWGDIPTGLLRFRLLITDAVAGDTDAAVEINANWTHRTEDYVGVGLAAVSETLTVEVGGTSVTLTLTGAGFAAQADNTLLGNVSGATAPPIAVSADQAQTVLETATTPFNKAGKQTIFVPAAAMRPTVSNGCAALSDIETTAGQPDMQVLDFDTTTDEHAQFQVAFPKSWDLGTVTYQVFWTSTATDTDGVAWGLQAVAVTNDGTIDVAYGTAVVVTDNNISAAEDLLVTAESGAVTIGGTPADDDLCFFRVFRDVSDPNDVMTEDARLIGIKLFFTTDAKNDA